MTDLQVYLRAAWAVRSGADLYTIIDDNQWHYHYPALFAILMTPLADPPAGEPMLVPVKNASALDVAALVNRLLTESAGQPGAQLEAQQRVALVADPRSNSILIRADNPARGARVRQLIEQLDTPTRVGGNVFIVYLKNAEAEHVAETLRGLYGGERAAVPTTAATTASALPAALPTATSTTVAT